MLFTSAYILNYAEQVNQFQIHPFCHSLSNVQTASDATRSITIPDVSPSETLREGTLSMAAGDFLEIYRDENGRLVLPVTSQVMLISGRRMGCGGDLFLYRHGSQHHRLSGNYSKTSETWGVRFVFFSVNVKAELQI